MYLAHGNEHLSPAEKTPFLSLGDLISNQCLNAQNNDILSHLASMSYLFVE